MTKINNHKTITRMFLLVVAVTFLLASLVVECRVGEPGSIVTTRNLFETRADRHSHMKCPNEYDDCKDDDECCSGLRCRMGYYPDGGGICDPDTTTRNLSDRCLPTGKDCFSGSDCCANRCRWGKEKPGTCLPGTNRGLVEGTYCLPDGSGTCLSNSDCCSQNCGSITYGVCY